MNAQQAPALDARHTAHARDFMEALPDASVHLLVTDPPWQLYGTGKFLEAANYPLVDPVDLVKMLGVMRRKLVPGGHAYIFAPSGEWFEPVLRAFVDDGWTFDRLLCWDKALRGLGGAWRNAFEPIFVFANGTPRKVPRTGSWPTLLRQRAAHTRTAKPPAMYRTFLEASSSPGDVVVDPFCGLNPLAPAAQQEPKRRWIACDILPPDTVAEQAVDKNRKSRTVPRRGAA